ncbi:MAG: hypothetical protein LC753_01465 [Acidobacteria bacterium]|nr:hypothetical protein [Acidobacteriota bacterium]MCA1648978.1 hypothetical protein [Acidobacteriota bacterium]
MRALCDDAEVTPIHPFKLEQRVTESDTKRQSNVVERTHTACDGTFLHGLRSSTLRVPAG